MKNSIKSAKLFDSSLVSSTKGMGPRLDEEHSQWMMKVKSGDVKAFEKIFSHYQGAVVNYAYAWVKNQTVAEDVAQDAFLKIYRFRDSYEPTANFAAWLWTIVRNTALDHLRKKKEILLDHQQDSESDDQTGSAIDEIESPVNHAELQLIEETDRLQVEKCMEKITLTQKDALNLRLVSELSYEEIAKTLGTSVSAIKSLLNRAKQALIQCFERNKK